MAIGRFGNISADARGIVYRLKDNLYFRSMAYDEKLADRLREALAHLPKVEEKKMFRGVTFMVNKKMCVNVSGDELMCRFDPAQHETVSEKNGFRTMIMKGREYKGFGYVTQDAIKSKKDFEFWINLCLEFNSQAKASKKVKKPAKKVAKKTTKKTAKRTVKKAAKKKK